ncbi:MAG: branched-chain amino acid transaminase [Anaerolineae bacterium]
MSTPLSTAPEAVQKTSAEYAFFKGQFVRMEDAKISVMTHALHYGTACFAGIRGYWNNQKEELYVFRLRDHYKRFLQSCKLLMMELPYSQDDLMDITLELIRREGYRTDVYIRPLAYKSFEGIGVRLHGVASDFTLFAYPFGRYIENEEGCHAMVSSFRRVDDNAIPARGKIAGSYVNSALAKSEAELAGFDEAIVLTHDGHVSEGSATNMFIVRDGVAITAPIVDNILEGITRRTVMQILAEDMGVPVVERSIDHTELYVCDEAFFCGTGVQLSIITRISHRPVGDGKAGPVASELRDRYFDVVRGANGKYLDWCFPVYSK